MSIQSALEEGLAHHRAGRLAEAARLYERVLAREPHHAEALHLLGVTAHQRGIHAQAVALISEAVAAEPANARFLNDLGQAQRAAGSPQAAAESYRRALAVEPGHAPAHNNLGLILAASGDLVAAETCFRRAVEADGTDADYYANLGYALMGLQRFDAAAEVFESAVSLAPRMPELHRGLGRAELERGFTERASAHFHRALELDPSDLETLHLLGTAARRAGDAAEARRWLGRLLDAGERPGVLADLALVECEAGDLARAEALCRRAVALDPHRLEAQLALARILLEQRRYVDAEAAARTAMALEPRDDAAPGWLGFALYNQGRLEEASDAFLLPVRRLRAPGGEGEMPANADPTFTKMSLTKLEHDIAQLEYLLQRERIDAAKGALLDAYREFAREHASGIGRAAMMDVPADHPIAPYYNRLLLDAPEPAIEGGALNRDLDFEAIATAFHASPLGFVQLDDLLNPAALAALQRFCVEPTIWFEMKFHSEVGSSLCNGFCCPLLLQIAAEIRRALPSIFAAHDFTTCWTYKYFQDDSDGHIHADHGAASVNLWVTPDEANLEPGTGGLIIWNKTLPRRFFRARGEEQMRVSLERIAEPDARRGYVPYRCNRAMIFRSNVLHKTERLKFRAGYADRRVSITFLYGKPG